MGFTSVVSLIIWVTLNYVFCYEKSGPGKRIGWASPAYRVVTSGRNTQLIPLSAAQNWAGNNLDDTYWKQGIKVFV